MSDVALPQSAVRSASPAWLLLRRMIRRRLVVLSLLILLVVLVCGASARRGSRPIRHAGWTSPIASRRLRPHTGSAPTISAATC